MLHAGRLGTAAYLFIFARGLIAAGAPMQTPDAHRYPDEFGRQTWETENGLPQNTVHSILQSRDGYIWVATEGGLARFDGVKFVVYNAQNTPALKSNNIRTLAETRDGALWIATADGIARFENRRFSAFSTADGLPGNNVWSLYEDRAGTLCAVTAEGLAKFAGGRFQSSGVPDNAALTDAMAADTDGTVWVGTRSGVKTLAERRLPEKGWPARISNADIQVLLFSGTGIRWVGTSKGLYEFTSDGRARAYTKKNGLPADRITALFEDRNHTVWVGTDAGLTTIVGDAVVPLSPNNTFQSETILALAQYREGDIWV